MNVPALRFPVFVGEWEEKRTGDFLKLFRKRVPATTQVPVYTSSRTGLRPQKDHFDGQEITNEGEYGVVPRGYFTYRHMSDDLTFKFNINDVDEEIAVSKEYPVFTTENLCTEFLHLKLNHSVSFQKFAAMQKLGGTRTRLYFKTLEEWRTLYPSLPEQMKIAAFLGVVDAKIAALRARVAGLERYKRGLMQALFSRTLRFTKKDGTAFPDWEEKRLGEVFERVTRKNAEDNQNVLTISAQRGLVNQRDYFNKSVSANDVSGYYLLEKGDFAYNKSYSKGYPMGAIKRLNLFDRGVVSTLYICFSTKSETSAKFYEQFFEFGGLNREIHKIAQEGARNHGLLNMSVVEFFKDMTIPFPHLDEQTKIAEALSAMDANIVAVTGQLDRMQEFKKGLLQQMFV